ncbi:MAG: 4-(cytidine 5'-diphospho)-2-C-methyl-D-erythritol kinase [Bacteroidota bacterium]|nr:4-(cytidine 5'-diphospho)-2-C-methyl-D-erythritol kinase [Bacteroidota bacterium]
MISYPHAKINLGLNIVEKRDDGFHNIETLFYPVTLCDIMEILPSTGKETIFTTSGILIPGDPGKNLVLRAYNLLSQEHTIPPVSIHLHKIIPMGSGLGGGSADAAFALIMLNKIFNLNLTEEKLESYASRLGSDCPFFIRRHPVFATKKGEQMEPVGLDLSGFHILIAVPGIHIDTSEAYSMIAPRIPLTGIRRLLKMPLESWRENLVNDFEKPISRKYPEINHIKERLYDSGAAYASMSGSGSAVFGIFRSRISLPEEFKNYFTWQGELIPSF